MKKYILASGSPDRKRLLTEAGFVPDKIIPADIDETPFDAELPADYVKRMALEKTKSVHLQHPNTPVLGADTIVTVHGLIIGKSKNDDEQRRVMQTLSGTTHQVLTAVCLIDENGKIYQDMSVMELTMKTLTDKEIEQYVASRHWVGCAGFNNDAIMDSFTEKLSGSYSGMVGIPLCVVRKMFLDAKIIEND